LDLYLAIKLAAHHDFQTIDYVLTKYREAIAIISMADLVVGGRQHPNIFAAKYGVPFIGLERNRHKMQGVIELLNYPALTFSW
jgi:polysaccharide pyruvyl transferase WcaK-like protein